MPLPLVNQFLIPFEFWETRKPNDTKINTRRSNGCHPMLLDEPVKVNCIDIINTPEKSAFYISSNLHSEDIERHITKSLNEERSKYKEARQAMPNKTPEILSEYQRLYGTKTNMEKVNNEIIATGDLLADNQILFHAGAILKKVQVGSSLITTRPLSTSFCPTKATSNGEWRGKFFHENEANLIILTVKSMSKKAFVFKIYRTDKGHEKEVLIESGATLTVTSKTLLNQVYFTSALGDRPNEILEKPVRFYMVHATIS
ncbi:hypothetical protein [Pectobacterium parmentieri]|nr:hypothetical protein [Pectobacterium parmentieri]